MCGRKQLLRLSSLPLRIANFVNIAAGLGQNFSGHRTCSAKGPQMVCFASAKPAPKNRKKYVIFEGMLTKQTYYFQLAGSRQATRPSVLEQFTNQELNHLAFAVRSIRTEGTVLTHPSHLSSNRNVPLFHIVAATLQRLLLTNTGSHRRLKRVQRCRQNNFFVLASVGNPARSYPISRKWFRPGSP